MATVYDFLCILDFFSQFVYYPIFVHKPTKTNSLFVEIYLAKNYFWLWCNSISVNSKMHRLVAEPGTSENNTSQLDS